MDGRRRDAKPRGTRRTLLLTLALAAALMACRPCHGHDPELVDLDEEDGKPLSRDLHLATRVLAGFVSRGADSIEPTRFSPSADGRLLVSTWKRKRAST